MSGDRIVEVLIPGEAPEDDREKIIHALFDAAHEVEPKDRDGWDLFVSAGPANGVVHIGHNGGHRARRIVERVISEEIGADDLVNQEIADKIVQALIEGEKL